VPSNGVEHELASLGLDRARCLVEEGSSEVAGHHDDCVAEVDDTALPVRETTVVQDLKRRVHEHPPQNRGASS
jgi:hypothetical protein